MSKQNNQKLSFCSEEFYHQLSQEYSEKKLFTFLDENGVSSYMTGNILAKRIRAVSARLQEILKPQERVLIVLPQGLEYIYSMLACLSANVIAIPTANSSTQTDQETIEKLLPIIHDSASSCIITDTRRIQTLESDKHFNDIKFVNIDQVPDENSTDVKSREHTGEDIALLLYTSGSVSQPKGVMLTHNNVLNQAFIGAKQWYMTKDSRIVSWMPQFHNFGLFFNFMAPLLKGASSVIFSPDCFVKSPELWFQTMGRYECTHTAAPNFAFDYCYNVVDLALLKDVNLHSIQAIISGGEAVRKETYENFIEKFKIIGLKQDIFCPHYGMSEAGSVTTKKPGEPIRFLALDITKLEKGKLSFSEGEKGKYVTGCGDIGSDTEVVLVNTQTGQRALADEIGEVWIKSSAVGVGYYNQKEKSTEAFEAKLNGYGSDHYFRTGDLGFVKDNHLYLIGREKEVIIIRGKNYYPVDLEWTIKKHLPDLILPLSVFSKEVNGEEKIIVVQEVEGNKKETQYQKIINEIRECISEVYTLDIWEVVLVSKDMIPKTGSGKIQRRKCKNLYLNHELKVLYSDQKEISHIQKEHVDMTRNRQEDKIVSILINEIVSKVLQMEPAVLKGTSTFGELGLDSMMYVRISKQIEEVFCISFAPAMLFKYRSIEKLAHYISAQIQLPAVTDTICQKEGTEDNKKEEFSVEDIAVIGMSCNFPGNAENPKAFWHNIVNEKDCITSIEDSRCEIRKDYENSYGDMGGTFPKWGGFIKDADRFDAPFFGISPLEAESMDPQQRKILELIWSVIEDSGYDPKKLADSPVGLFMGVHNNDYAELILKNPQLMDTYGAYLDSGLHMSMTTHRSSRWFNFHGPSEAINTACSSSLIAVHHAVEAIHRKECTMAIAGGINLMFSSRVYTASYKAGMLSEDGHCKTFDESADGFVRSEGYGAVLLKSYSQACRDHDSIYGVIKGTAINHDGQSNSLRAPNPNAQKELIISAYKKAGVPAETVGFIEAHGTGTALGDPIEFQALKDAFEELGVTRTEAFCGLGTVKTNIGHSESAAGIAGLIKVLLSMKHKTLPGILHFNSLNPYISLKDSPFYIVDSTREWKRLKDADGNDLKRRAGISSFGYGGANAHIIVEEYEKPQEETDLSESGIRVLVPLSAKNKEVLYAQVKQLAEYLKTTGENKTDLYDLAYTLQIGRCPMEERIVLLTDSIPGLFEKLEGFLNKTSQVSGLWQTGDKNGSNSTGQMENHEDVRLLIEKCILNNELEQIAQYFVQGKEIPWNMFYKTKNPHRMNLPTYPFEKHRYWIPEAGGSMKTCANQEIHPLLQRNTSSFSEQRYSTVFTGKEPFLEDHAIMGKKVLPGAIQLEMVRAAFEKASDTFGTSSYNILIKEMVWAKPVSIGDDAMTVHVGLVLQKNGDAAFELYSEESPDEAVIYSYGFINTCAKKKEKLDLREQMEACKREKISGTEIYHRFDGRGISYGKSHQGIKEVHVGHHSAIAELSLQLDDAGSFEQLVIYPGIVDSALQATIVLEDTGNEKRFLPYSIREVEIMGNCAPNMWVCVKRLGVDEESRLNRYRISICDENGNVCIKINELTMAAAEGNSGPFLYYPSWNRKPVSVQERQSNFEQRVVILMDPKETLIRQYKQDNEDCIILHPEKMTPEESYQYCASFIFKQLQSIIKNKRNQNALLQFVVAGQTENKKYLGLAGMLKTARLENPKLAGQVILLDHWENLKEILDENSMCPEDAAIFYDQGNRYVEKWNRLEKIEVKQKCLWKDRGVYLITGGLGGIGIQFAKEAARTAEYTTLILTGRSELDEKKSELLRGMKDMGIDVVYKQMDVSVRQDVMELMQEILAEHKTLNGIIHAAGIIRDNFILKKTENELKEVMRSKVNGICNLDQESRNISLDFFIICSSVAGCMGNAGQCDYAAANAFLDQYASYRDGLVEAGKRSGRTISIDWPLWKEGGMQVNSAVEESMKKNMGMVPMTAEAGMRALYQSFEAGKPQIMVIEGIEERIYAYITQTCNTASVLHVPAEKDIVSERFMNEAVRDHAVSYFKELLAAVIHLPAQEMNEDLPMEQYGIDSIMIMKLNDRLEQIFGVLPKTLFFEYQNIRLLAEYFIENFSGKLSEMLELNEKVYEPADLDEGCITPDNVPLAGRMPHAKRNRFRIERRVEKETNNEDIAIIGLAGRYPGAGNIDGFWDVLKNGRDCVTEIPKDRWDYNRYFDKNKNAEGKTYTKWGGFIDGVDEFDPLFFKISPKEAEQMDPQERLFLQIVESAMEDAGYSTESLGRTGNGAMGRNIGVFVGVMFEEYQLYGAQEQAKNHAVALSGSIASIANRVSYFYNLHGPSMAVDTMCSSSLTALHLACQSLQSEGCQMAIAGGVNVSIHPNKYLLLAQGRFASSKGRCESFGEGGDGYVPGEGVGAVLLKPLSKAIGDQDHIYGIIKATAVNHGGKTNGYTVPNPNAQADVINEAFRKAGINPRSINYLEAHGTGTALGDPIEIAGLTKTFRNYTADKQFCSIGSVKSNIGHCESAAGMAGLTKILLQLQHGQLVPSLHSTVLNKNIDFTQTPFTVQQELVAWDRVKLEENGKVTEYPRRAGLSAFGAGGSNAHIILEEYIPVIDSIPKETKEKPVIIVLSANNEERLAEQVENLRKAVQNPSFSNEDLTYIAYTLQVGRFALEERLAFIAATIEELKNKLEEYLKKKNKAANIYRGSVKQFHTKEAALGMDEDIQDAIKAWIKKKKYEKLSNVWVSGMSVDWELLYTKEEKRRISLPAYPFARERYWLTQTKEAMGGRVTGPVHTYLHPLLHRNTSNLQEQRFSSVFSGNEFFVKDHVILGEKVLPGAAYLEMIRKALLESLPGMEKNVVRLTNIVWQTPFAVTEDEQELHIRIFPGQDNRVCYEVYSDRTENLETVHCQGSAEFLLEETGNYEEKINIEKIRKEGRYETISGEKCYQLFRSRGIDYGSGHQGIETLYVEKDHLLAKLTLKDSDIENTDDYLLHPGLLDSAIQSSIGFDIVNSKKQPLTLSLPFALEEIEIRKKCGENMWAVVRRSKDSHSNTMLEKMNFDLCNESGELLVRLRGLSFRAMERKKEHKTDFGAIMLQPVWKQKNALYCKKQQAYIQRRVVLCEPEKEITADRLEELLEPAVCEILRSEEMNLAGRYETYARYLFQKVKQLLMGSPKVDTLFQLVVFEDGEKELFKGLGGILKTASLENPGLLYQIIQLPKYEKAEEIVNRLEENKDDSFNKEIKYEKGIRYVKALEETGELGKEAVEDLPWKEGGVYLITGGAGGLGLIIAEEIAQKVGNVTLFLTGRAELDKRRQEKLDTLKKTGGRIEYRKSDITSREQAESLIAEIIKTAGGLNGIIHSAGIIRDNFIIHKSEEEFKEVLQPKVRGLIELDACTRNQKLDFILLFSSQAGEMGNPGQADYAAANSFMDVFAGYRNRLAETGICSGKTSAINWPLWELGGMHIEKEIEKRMFETTGMIPLRTATGITALYRALDVNQDQIMFLEGDERKLRQVFVREEKEDNNRMALMPDGLERHAKPTLGIQEKLKEKTQQYFKKLLSAATKIPVKQIDTESSFEKYGIDSVMIMQMTDELEKSFASLPKTLFFEYQNIESISEYFIEAHRDRLMELLKIGDGEETCPEPFISSASQEMPLSAGKTKPARFTPSVWLKNQQLGQEEIAVIGVAGRYPQAETIEELWDVLSEGKDCITTIPKERWNYQEYYDEDRNKEGKTYSKWGGFIKDVDKFDPLFFNISPHEAELMDPQERLFLECSVNVLEDAGYTRETLGKYQKGGLEGNVGVYAGIMYDEYQLYGVQEQNRGHMVALNGITSSVANRVSYYCNFHGPSISLNTMCSSSLVAIHMACQSIRLGECELAIAGGVNVSIHPNKYLLLGKSNFLSSRGKCESFGTGGDGYVPGEGVGAVLLKPLSKAIMDKDHIYGVIKGSSINHGGRTNGYTVPNPAAQAEAIRASLLNAGVEAEKISYIEAHGTGTSLGDPIEISALSKVFEEQTDEKQFCAIGSVKSNLGHLESAAGIVALTKVLLQMKYGKLVPSLHSSSLNENIDFGNTPFKVQQKLEDWKRIVIEKNGVRKEYPRTAGISSFGAGGTNAHLIIQEFIQEEKIPDETRGETAIIVLSAKEEVILKKSAGRLLEALEKRNFEEYELSEIAYTLQVGREAMEIRLGLLATSIQELKNKLKQYIEGEEDIEDLYFGNAKLEKDLLTMFKTDDDMKNAVASWIQKKKHKKLLRLWVAGVKLQWELLYPGHIPHKISLPLYPFARESYWVPEDRGALEHNLSAKDAFSGLPVTSKDQRTCYTAELEAQPVQKQLKDRMIHYLKSLLCKVSKVPFEKVDADFALEEYGIDSIMIKQLTAELEKDFGLIEMTLFFEYQNLQALAGYFIKQYEDKTMEMFGLKKEETEKTKDIFYKETAVPQNIFTERKKEENKEDFEIAVIGLSGRYPMANNLNEYWENLKNGKDCIVEIPEERWDYSLYYDKNKSEPGKISSKWGGFIEGVDQFDPMFFNILPEDARFMDPQERLFLECVYETLEDAGYTKESLSKDKDSGLGGEVGVFVGVTFSEYQFYGVESQLKGKPAAISGITSSIANRVSYFCNFNGPSMSVDSMCSSSLTALGVAFDSMKQGGCKLAVVGGVNLSLHPNKYLFLSQYQFLSSKGRCESFGEGGDGYVPGEGVGAMLLKPLAQAKADGDHIYGIIKAVAMNHGGKTNGYSVPNPKAQTNVINKALAQAKVNPRQISYIEAHGTGTSLGDPIEIAGITKAFEKYTKDRNFCAIGSAKSNIGHLEAAAGIAGITKVLLQMKHKQLVPSIHAEVLNSNIDFTKTPFQVQKQLMDWKTFTTMEDGEERELPRIAGISSFGAGGANAHVIIEEYVPEKLTQIPVASEMPSFIILSAKDIEILKEQAKQLLEWVTRLNLTPRDLEQISYTLQVGREQMETRLGIIVKSIEDLKEKLQGYLAGEKNLPEVYLTRQKGNKEIVSIFKTNEEFRKVIDTWMKQKNYSMLLELWTAGFDLNWEALYPDRKPKRISLPTYPFKKDKYWFTQRQEDTDQKDRNRIEETGDDVIFWHPVWEKAANISEGQNTSYDRRYIILCEQENEIAEVKTQINGAECRVLCCKGQSLDIRYSYYAKQIFVLIKEILLTKSSGNVFIQLVIFEKEEKAVFRGLGALLKTAAQENPKLEYQIVQFPAQDSGKKLVEKLEICKKYLKNTEIRFDKEIFYRKSYEEASQPEQSRKTKIPWKEGGIYVITGGAGGLGMLVAEEIICKTRNVIIFLTGRSNLSQDRQEKLKDLNSKGAVVKYKKVDISKDEQTKEFFQELGHTYGRINGIIHSAGITRDHYIINKTEAEFEEVLQPKVTGLLKIDQYTKEFDLDFLLLFSSGVAEFGNPGQADYSAANAFMDEYAEYRNMLVERGERKGSTISVNWPLWEKGGMKVDQEIQRVMFETKGMIPMKTETGILALYDILAGKNTRTILTVGDKLRIRKEILELETASDETRLLSMDQVSDEELLDKVTDKLMDLFGDTLKLKREFINTEETFEDYGIDSVKLTVLSQRIAPFFKNLSNTIFFEYRTLAALSEYLLAEYPGDCIKWVGSSEKKKKSETGSKRTEWTEAEPENDPIAIIGVSCRFPEANNVSEFWEVLKEGKACVREIPKERWSLENFYEPDRERALEQKKSFSKWGAFLDDFADFDPLFFNISPAEAERMDPQERIFLEECWKAVEDAGYVPSKMEESLRSKTGVFGGITKTGFDSWNHTSNKFYSTSFSGMVNRVSYFMDFNGPSIPVDTMCSSGLAAIHQACESIRHGELKMAVAGAVNLYLHPSNYTSLSQAGMISDTPDNSVFAKGGTGFTPSEGVGAVVLKRLSEAQKDHDAIWGVIRGSALVHSGKTNGYHVPDPAKQAAVIEKALQASAVHPATIRHIETAASGSEMADSIEMTAIEKVFQNYRKNDKRFHTMGSVKTVLGHGEAVSGIAQLIKSLLQLKNKTLCPTRLPQIISPNIKFDTLPFRVETELVDWPDTGNERGNIPRRIGINSFGAGGVYAHVILEEYAAPEESFLLENTEAIARVYPFSAKTDSALKAYLNVWKEYLKKHPDMNMEQLAYTLQMRRETMKIRFASVAGDAEELICNLEDHLNGAANANNYSKNVRSGIRAKQMEGRQDPFALAGSWVAKGSAAWNELYDKYIPYHISQLPTYPFRKKQFWITPAENSQLENTTEGGFLSLDVILNGKEVEESVNPQDIRPLIKRSGTEQQIREILFRILYLDESDEIDNETEFAELGLDSLSIGRFIQMLNRQLSLDLQETVVFDYPNIKLLADYIVSQMKERL